jgi:hypothetical protein
MAGGAESSRGMKEETRQSLHAFFNGLKEEASPFAIRAIREETGTALRDDNIDDVALAPHQTMRQSIYD